MGSRARGAESERIRGSMVEEGNSGGVVAVHA